MNKNYNSRCNKKIWDELHTHTPIKRFSLRVCDEAGKSRTSITACLRVQLQFNGEMFQTCCHPIIILQYFLSRFRVYNARLTRFFTLSFQISSFSLLHIFVSFRSTSKSCLMVAAFVKIDNSAI